eukprot:10215363-Alexandrium_andersonii.AAC.1
MTATTTSSSIAHNTTSIRLLELVLLVSSVLLVVQVLVLVVGWSGLLQEERLSKDLQDAVSSGSFQLRGALGQRFAAEHKSGEARAQYQACQTHKKKEEFRAEWARRKYETVVQGVFGE